MKSLALLLCLVGSAALVAGFASPMDTTGEGVTASAPTAPEGCPNLGDVDDEAVGKATCRNCGSGSTGACSGAQQCRGSEKDCRAKGCKDTGYSSCSTAANVKIC